MEIATASRTRRQTEKGELSRAAILEAATRLVTVAGLEGLSIGRLADHIGMSKSGLYAHFRSKEQLQLATIDAAVEIYTRAMIEPAMALPPGVGRLLRVTDDFFDLVGSGQFPGGCFFIYTAFDAALQRGHVQERLVAEQRSWLEFIEQLATEAIEVGELPADTNTRDLTFELHAYMAGADTNFVLLGDRAFLGAGRAAVRRRLGLG